MEHVICMLIGIILGLIIAPITISVKHESPENEAKEAPVYELTEADKKFLEEQQQMVDAAREIQRMFIGDDEDAR